MLLTRYVKICNNNLFAKFVHSMILFSTLLLSFIITLNEQQLVHLYRRTMLYNGLNQASFFLRDERGG